MEIIKNWDKIAKENEDIRQSTFNTSQNNRQSTFNNNEQKRQNTFNTNESTRQSEFGTIKADYNTYKDVMTDESNVAKLQEQINTANQHLAHMANDKLSKITSSDSVFSLPNSQDGQLSFNIKGRTMYKRSDGTYTDTFEEGCTLESTGEGQDKIEVLNRSKNYFDINTNYNVVTPNTDYFYADGVLKVSNSDSNGTWRSIKIQKPIRLKAFTQYTISAKKNIIRGSDNCGYIGIKDLQGYNIKDLKGKDNYITFTTDKTGMVYLNFFSAGINAEIAEVEFTNIQLEEGTEVTEYEPYKQDKIDILNTVLRQWDTVDKNGVKSIGTKQIALNDISGWQVGLSKNDWLTSGDTLPFYATPSDLGAGIICDKFNVNQYIYTEDTECIADRYVGNRIIAVRILKSKLVDYGYVEEDTTTYAPAFKAWLEDNPVIVYYQLADEYKTTEQLPQPLCLQSFANGSMVLDSTIPPQISVNYPTSLTSGIAQNAKGVAQNRTNIKSIYDALYLLTLEVENLKNNNSEEV